MIEGAAIASLKFWKNPNRKGIYPGFFAPVLWGSSRRGQTWNWLRLSASHHDFIFGEPLDRVGDHRWNFGLAVCGLFRAFSRMRPPKRKLSLIGKAVQQVQREPSFSLVNPSNLSDGY
jgi:hypothetical protein